jgi:hypothetical protein
MGAPCRVTFGERVFFKPDFVKRFLDTLHLEDSVVEESKYLKSIGYDNAFNEGDPLLIREKKAEAKAGKTKPILSKSIDVESSDGRKGLVPTSELEEFIGEDRLGEAQMTTSRETIDRLKEDIAKNGFKEPIVIVYDKFSGDGEATIIEGNHRIIAAKELGLTEVPVTFEKGTIRDNESRVKDRMFPIKRKTVGKLNDTRGVKGSDLGLTVRQPTDADFVETSESTPQAKAEDNIFTYDKDGNIVEATVIAKGKNTTSVLIDGKQTTRANTELFNNKEEAQTRLNETAETNIFDDLDASRVSGAKAKQVAANKAFKEKHGDNAAVAKAISTNFEAIANELKEKGIFTKIKCD